MCKVFAITNAKKVKINAKMISTVKAAVTKTDNDGFGYALLAEDNSIGGERTIKPEYFLPLQGDPKARKIFNLPIAIQSSNMFGVIKTKSPKSFIAHGRWSTNTVSLKNTHPFVNKEMALIHNGVVYDHSNKVNDKLKTDCDTEILLRHWESGGFKSIEKNVSGYYAIAALDKKGKLHIIRDDRAMLYISWSETIESYIIATTTDIITEVCKKLKWKFEQPEEMIENAYAIFDGNELDEYSDINPKGSYGHMTAAERGALYGHRYNEGYTYSDGAKHYDYNGSVKSVNDKSDKEKLFSSEEIDSLWEAGIVDATGEPYPDHREEYKKLVAEREAELEEIRQMELRESKANQPEEDDPEEQVNDSVGDVVDKINEGLKRSRAV